MKKLFLTTMIIVSMLLGTSEMRAQTTEAQLNQVELLKLYFGTWKSDYKDTTEVFVMTPYGKGMQVSFKQSTKGKVLFQCKQVWGYDKESDKTLGIQFVRSSSSTVFYVCWFTSKNVNETIEYVVRNDGKLEKTNSQWKEDFKSRDMFIQSHMINNKTVSMRTFMRVK